MALKPAAGVVFGTTGDFLLLLKRNISTPNQTQTADHSHTKIHYSYIFLFARQAIRSKLYNTEMPSDHSATKSLLLLPCLHPIAVFPWQCLRVARINKKNPIKNAGSKFQCLHKASVIKYFSEMYSPQSRSESTLLLEANLAIQSP